MGIYSLSYNVYSIVATVKLAMDYIVGPFYFEKRETSDFYALQKIFNTYSRCLSIISVLIMLCSPEIIRILGGTPYFDARYSAIPLIAVSYFSFLCYMISQEEYFLQKTYIVSIISVTAMVLNIILCSIFVPRLETIGAAFSTLASFVFMFFAHFITIKILLKSQAFCWKSLLVDGAFVTIMSIVVVSITDYFLPRVFLIVVMLLVAIFFMQKNLRLIKR